MNGGAVAVCPADRLVEGGDGVRFPVATRDGPTTAFVVRFRGLPRGYLNRCAHVGVELDWDHGKFFDRSGLYLMCATHGAVYAPDTGRCSGGPCRNSGLKALTVEEHDGTVWWLPDSSVSPPTASE